MSKQRAKGTAWESKIAAYLRANGFPYADRVPLSGHKDRGDVKIGPGGPILEAKDQNRHSWAEWLDEATVEAANSGAPFGVVWAHRRGHASPGEGYVLMDGATFTTLLAVAGYGCEP